MSALKNNFEKTFTRDNLINYVNSDSEKTV